ncbi:MAG TPA: endolytic transglycosylase MltG [Candidatus Paceibacterota bacterium]|jgi:UPF0755 protein|nr:endolytic transglycosylase MltG [Candidatus Paceibacterota bacterium]HRS47959.1 endolytic transglycosylase MltG [Candidatus Paceibacterota bacterium]
MLNLTDEELKIYQKREKIGFLIMFLTILIPIAIWLFFVFSNINQSFKIEPEKIIVINKNEGFLEITDKLVKEQILPSNLSPAFKIYLIVSGKASQLKEGSYVLIGDYSLTEFAQIFITGPQDITITIPEGYTVFDIDQKLSQAGLIKKGEIIDLAQKPTLFDYPFLKSDSVTSLEGFLFPDTYRFSQKTTAFEIIDKMLKNFESKVYQSLPIEIQNSPDSIVFNIILASIVEKEAKISEDRKMITDILVRRLEKEMPLQVDATIIYAWKIINPDWQPQGGLLSKSDLEIKSPYNSYLNKGLPPSAISNPGLDAIEDVFNPTSNDYWYYLSTPEGEIIYSKTLEEHNQAIEKYLK